MEMKPKTAEFWMVIFLYLLPNWKLEAEAKVRIISTLSIFNFCS